MGTLIILKSGLVLHITGIVMMVGTFLASLIAYQQFWKLFQNEKDKALTLFNTISRFQIVQMIGGALIIIGGIIMMIAFHGVLMHTMWFKIKMGVLILIILNAVFVARPAEMKLKQLLAVEQTGKLVEELILTTVKRKIMLFYYLQFMFFLTIFILSTFQFN